MTSSASGRDRGTTIIFTLPSKSPERNCSGTVTALQYCYQARARDIDIPQNIFDFVSLSKVEGSSQFTVIRIFPVTTSPQENECTDPSGSVQRICCTTTALNSTIQFQVTSLISWFGIILRRGSGRRPLTFTNSNTVYRVDQYEVRPNGDSGPSLNAMLTVNNPRSDRSLLLLRLLIGMIMACVH